MVVVVVVVVMVVVQMRGGGVPFGALALASAWPARRKMRQVLLDGLTSLSKQTNK